VAGRFRTRFVPKDPAGNRTAEQIDDAVTAASYNNMNQLVSQQAGGALVFKGTVSEPASVTVSGRPATVTADNRFEGQAVVPSGTGQVAVTATDPSGNLRTNTYEVTQGATSKAFTYDANGNMTSDGARTYEWDAENRLVAIKDGGNTIASYTFTHHGIRASKTVAGVTTAYVLEDADVVEERVGTGGTTRHFQGPPIDNVLAMQDGGGVATYLTRDHLGSVREHMNSAGVLTLRRDYDPWGNMSLGASVGGWAYTGRENEPELALLYYRARYYDRTLGRFISEDPIGLDGGVNFYAYVANSPVSRTDPSGQAGIGPKSPFEPPAEVVGSRPLVTVGEPTPRPGEAQMAAMFLKDALQSCFYVSGNLSWKGRSSIGVTSIAKSTIVQLCGMKGEPCCPTPGYAAQFFITEKNSLAKYVTRVNLRCEAITEKK
jgi:RHS repeat-associated protein